MKIKSLDKELYVRLLAQGVSYLTLNFSGGSDEGYLNIECDTKADLNSSIKDLDQLYSDIDTWVWSVYEYSGAGDSGSEYGDNITYDLVNKTATHDEWYTKTVTSEQTEPAKFRLCNKVQLSAK
jgi:hypothetical protein